MKSLFHLVLLITLCWSFTACSTLPKHILSENILKADEFYRLGYSFKQINQLEQALISYTLAHLKYLMVDHIDGIVLTQIALISMQLKMDVRFAYQDDLRELEKYVNLICPQFRDHVELLKAEAAMIQKNHSLVLELTENYTADERSIQLQLVGLRMLSLLSTGENCDSSYSELRENLRFLKRDYFKKKGQDGGIFSHLCYLMGYRDYILGRWQEAARHFESSLKLDKKAGDTVGIAQNLFYLGMVHMQLNDKKDARNFFLRARGIYRNIDDFEMLNKINQSLGAL